MTHLRSNRWQPLILETLEDGTVRRRLLAPIFASSARVALIRTKGRYPLLNPGRIAVEASPIHREQS